MAKLQSIVLWTDNNRESATMAAIFSGTNNGKPGLQTLIL